MEPTPCPPEIVQPDAAQAELLLTQARQALERGEYGWVLRSLEPLGQQHGPATPIGAQIQLLLATAWMGQGHGEQARLCCQQLRRSADPLLRAQARELLAVLEAPALVRPRSWSLTLPSLAGTEPLEGRWLPPSRRRRASGPPPPPPPPVGPTRAPLGFALLVSVLVLLALLLGGCADLQAELHFRGPGRLQLVEALGSSGRQLTPWQQQLGAALQRQGLRRSGDGRWQSPVLPAEEALELLAAAARQAARQAGVELPAPQWRWQERNLLLGVRQHLELQFDLRELQALPGLQLALELEPLSPRAIRHAEPLPVQAGAVQFRRLQSRPARQGSVQRWPLQPGAVNGLELRCWRWSPLGLGSVLIALALALAFVLQGLWRRLTPGLPALPGPAGPEAPGASASPTRTASSPSSPT